MNRYRAIVCRRILSRVIPSRPLATSSADDRQTVADAQPQPCDPRCDRLQAIHDWLVTLRRVG